MLAFIDFFCLLFFSLSRFRISLQKKNTFFQTNCFHFRDFLCECLVKLETSFIVFNVSHLCMY